ncbi:unnamed protein product [Gongylonema pulchrum]|uniref:Ig-like domain-containing protein n=1 Tax=Gongylonema pulchrum TaxID=637853 RepID=A0A183EKX4_9BILA|nr:unnamed protein product [Gongylonema pulchrum]
MILILIAAVLDVAAPESYYYGQRLERVPYFLATPSNASYREGSAVRLTCEATAKPRPVMAWYFNGEQITSNRKYSLNLDHSVLNIYPFQKSDVGKYICTATNRNGRVQHSFELQILNNSAPLIVDSPESKVVNPGEPVVLFCRASGQPPPTIKWYFDGVEVARNDPHIELTRRDTELTIIHATREDEGVYQCMARNSLGAATAEATVKVYVPNQQALDESLTSELLSDIVKQARQNVDRLVLPSELQN